MFISITSKLTRIDQKTNENNVADNVADKCKIL